MELNIGLFHVSIKIYPVIWNFLLGESIFLMYNSPQYYLGQARKK